MSMRSLLPSETELVGQWRVVDGRVQSDEVCDRINWLVSAALKEVARDRSGWDRLFVDPTDSRLWEATYPNSGLHGGGPPQLRVLSRLEAERKYGQLTA
jgi:hypothetical protein